MAYPPGYTPIMHSAMTEQTVTVAAARARGTVLRYEQGLPGFRPLVTLTVRCGSWEARGELVGGKAPTVWRVAEGGELCGHLDLDELEQESRKLGACVRAALAM